MTFNILFFYISVSAGNLRYLKKDDYMKCFSG